MDDDDKERSRGIPSRTGIGKRGAIIEKFPALGNPLVLLGGFITIQFWGYLNTPIAMMDVMIADLPHVQYSHKRHTKEEEENRMVISRDINDKIKNKGLANAFGVSFNLT